MNRAGDDSWGIDIAFDRQGSTMLFLRDAAGLGGPADYSVPALRPEVDLRAGLAPFATEDAAEQWRAWWQAHLERLCLRSRPGGGTIGPEPAPPPDPGTDLRALYERVADEAHGWVRERHQEYVGRGFSPLARTWQAQPRDTVTRIEQELGRKSAPFRLTVRVLPLARRWGRRVDGALVLVSEALWLDPDACDLFLDPVVRSLA